MSILPRRLAVILLFAPCLGCVSAERRQAVTEARNACYKVSSAEAYQELYAVISSEYPIARESERRGFIETDWKEGTIWGLSKSRTQISAEVVGEKCVRFAIRASTETYDSKSARWNKSGDSSADDIYLTLHERLRQYYSPPSTPSGKKPVAPSSTTKTKPQR